MESYSAEEEAPQASQCSKRHKRTRGVGFVERSNLVGTPISHLYTMLQYTAVSDGFREYSEQGLQLFILFVFNESAKLSRERYTLMLTLGWLFGNLISHQ